MWYTEKARLANKAAFEVQKEHSRRLPTPKKYAARIRRDCNQSADLTAPRREPLAIMTKSRQEPLSSLIQKNVLSSFASVDEAITPQKLVRRSLKTPNPASSRDRYSRTVLFMANNKPSDMIKRKDEQSPYHNLVRALSKSPDVRQLSSRKKKA